MDEQIVGTLTHHDLRADIYSLSIPGEFKVVYRDSSGKILEEAPLTGISSYHQREHEIHERLRQLGRGEPPQNPPDQGEPGEY